MNTFYLIQHRKGNFDTKQTITNDIAMEQSMVKLTWLEMLNTIRRWHNCGNDWNINKVINYKIRRIAPKKLTKLFSLEDTYYYPLAMIEMKYLDKNKEKEDSFHIMKCKIK